MKFLSSIWFLAGLALALAAGTTTVVLMKERSKPVVRTETIFDVEVDGSVVAALWNTQTGYVDELSKELATTLAELEAREGRVAQDEERIRQERLELERLQKDLVKTREMLTEMITRIEQKEVDNLRAEGKTLSEMEPAKVVEIFDTMSDVDVVKILYFMKPDIQAEIYSAMIESPQPNVGKDEDPDPQFGAKRVRRLNELLKFTHPPERPSQTASF